MEMNTNLTEVLSLFADAPPSGCLIYIGLILIIISLILVLVAFYPEKIKISNIFEAEGVSSISNKSTYKRKDKISPDRLFWLGKILLVIGIVLMLLAVAFKAIPSTDAGSKSQVDDTKLSDASNFPNSGSNAVRIGLTPEGRKIAVIGATAQQQYPATDGKSGGG